MRSTRESAAIDPHPRRASTLSAMAQTQLVKTVVRGGPQAKRACGTISRTHVRPRRCSSSRRSWQMCLPGLLRGTDRPPPQSGRMEFLPRLSLRLEDIDHRRTGIRHRNPCASPHTRVERSAGGQALMSEGERRSIRL